MADKPATAQLLHAVAELWVRHMRQAARSGRASDRIEINQEADALLALLEASKAECAPEASEPSVIDTIDAYLKLNEPWAAPCSITAQEGRPTTYLIQSFGPLTLDAGEWLDEHYPDIITLAWKPVGRRSAML